MKNLLNWLKNLFTRKPQEETSDLSERVKMWRSLVLQDTCWVCGKKHELYCYARGGLSENWECRNCNTRYYLLPLEDIGEQVGCEIIGDE